LAKLRPLWGNSSQVLDSIRDPFQLASFLHANGFATPEVTRNPKALPTDGSWLVKPRHGSGGFAVRPWVGQPVTNLRPVYYQKRNSGLPVAAIYCGGPRGADFLGATRQLVGEPTLNAKPFAYCGSIGPLTLASPVEAVMRRLGDALVRQFGLRGLFGVDGLVEDTHFVVIEVNPRYTASIEILERALGLHMIAKHAQVFAPELELCPRSEPSGAAIHGKAILYARQTGHFPETGPWLADFRSPPTIRKFADVPAAGTRLEAGWPILTVFTSGNDVNVCHEALLGRAAEVDLVQ
jgi:predicted ATP-grasp superfamily ATP-dependent carboligase